MHLLDLGPAQISRVTFSSVHTRRTDKLTLKAYANEAGALGEIGVLRRPKAARLSLAPQADASRGGQERPRMRLASIYRPIAENLGNPGLTPATIAAAHHMSTRCHWDLDGSTLRHWPIHATAAGWGIEDAAQFALAYRAKFGHTAQEYRRAAIERFLTAIEGTDDARGRDDRREGA
ncbi:hypothetical protein MF672_050265 [Actinomadura sp. ATCC 31491]|uniref:HTH araC/xylS-type domain-containing protein n=1 Tax=Actinomadura luzonensis TaxID=2805427 RepID=A0ABT0GBZ7_9ACTN|nr:hypothetical protein [Actinomadura luzonensis]MCK2221943.1 hypothetical protein [Actinomadura luzonensis]